MIETAPHRERCSGAVDVPYEFEAAGMTLTGRQCRVCGSRSAVVEQEELVEKPCSRCGKPFKGVPDAPAEPCYACFGLALDAWAEQIRTCQHDPAFGVCGKCRMG